MSVNLYYDKEIISQAQDVISYNTFSTLGKNKTITCKYGGEFLLECKSELQKKHNEWEIMEKQKLL